MSSLPQRAGRAVLSGASTARHRAAALHVPAPVHGLGTAVRRRAADLELEALRAGDDHPALDDPGRPHARTVGEGAAG